MDKNSLIREIRQAEENYMKVSPHDRNSIEGMNLFLFWHSLAGVAFSQIKNSAANPFFDSFMKVDRSGNGASLSSAFNAIRTEYEILMHFFENE